MNPVYADFLASVLGVISLIITVFVIPALRKRLEAGQTRDAVETITKIAGMVVQESAQRVRDLKDPSKPGVWNEATASLILQTALASVKSQAKPACDLLLERMGNDQSKLDEMIRVAVEANVEVNRPKGESK